MRIHIAMILVNCWEKDIQASVQFLIKEDNGQTSNLEEYLADLYKGIIQIQ
jgi:hypothetical protein